ncbi:amidohydrolase [Sphingobacterium corticibacterium]|uniref:Deaminase n=1 Tax=Sphingobacterium corticibacterium TaxID=2484746 RepID=A0A4Q6XXQ6_9SPHI|nr:amidohydrolase [Sphingobacterium corticibacterium]RZF62572.1 deaminase [Sphingobacterium corticibacterium]
MAVETGRVSRKDFLKTSSIGLAGAFLSPNIDQSAPNTSVNKQREAAAKSVADTTQVLKNVRLETGFIYENEQIVATQTDLFTIRIENGKIKSISPNDKNQVGTDASGWLMLPSFKDMHIHLDKTFYGDKWQAIGPRSNGVKGMIELEQKILPELLKNSTYKAEKLMELLQSYGTNFARSHVNIEPTSKLQSLDNLQKALENKKQSFGAEIVAFPQHGIFYTDSASYLKEAAQLDIDFIGGLDPYSIDGSIEKPVDYMVQLALDYGKGIDIHLHESGKTGVQTIEYLIDKAIENPALRHKTYISHAFALANMDRAQQETIAEKLASAGIGIASSVPFGNTVMPIPTLLKYGVEVLLGTDSVIDHWNTFGSGSVLQKANVAAQLYGASTEFALSRMLRLPTAGILPLDDQGVQQWPKEGDLASFALVDASCSAEAVSRISQVKSLYYEGHQVFI